MANIIDVARRANVSKTLVSRVNNNQKGVSAEARERILDAMKELNYRSNALARSLVLQKTETIAVILDSLITSFYFDFINAVQQQGEQAGYNVVFSSGNNDSTIKRRYIDYFTHGRADGIIVYGSLLSDESVIKDLCTAGFPFVLVENEIEGYDINNVRADNYTGAYNAVKHLIKLGHTDIVHFTGDINVKVSLERLNGYIRAMQDSGLALNSRSIVYSDFSEKSGYECMQSLLDQKQKPAAVFFGADMTAYGAIRAIYDNGLTVPGDIAIVGFDDEKLAECDVRFPKLTTVRQPMLEMGSNSLKLLVKKINSKNKTAERILLPTELVVRGSCGEK